MRKYSRNFSNNCTSSSHASLFIIWYITQLNWDVIEPNTHALSGVGVAFFRYVSELLFKTDICFTFVELSLLLIASTVAHLLICSLSLISIVSLVFHVTCLHSVLADYHVYACILWCIKRLRYTKLIWSIDQRWPYYTLSGQLKNVIVELCIVQ